MCEFVFTSPLAAAWWKALSSDFGLQRRFTPISSRYEAMLSFPPFILAELNGEFERLKKEAERRKAQGNLEGLRETEEQIERLSHVISLVTRLLEDLPGQLRAWDQLREAFRPAMFGNELTQFMTAAETLTPELIERLQTLSEIRRSLGHFVDSPEAIMRELHLTARRLCEAVVFDLQAWDSGNASATRAIWEAGSLVRARAMDAGVIDAMERAPGTLFGQWLTDFNGILGDWNGEGISPDRLRGIRGAFDSFYRELQRLQTEFDQGSAADHADALVRALSLRAEALLNALEAERGDPGVANHHLGQLCGMMASVLAVSLSRVQAQVQKFGMPSFSETRARNAAAAPPGGPPRIAPGGAWVHAVPRGGPNRGGAAHPPGEDGENHGDAPGEGVGLPGEAGAEAGRAGAEAGRLGAEAGWLGAEAGRLGAEAGRLGAEAGRLGAEAGDAGANAGRAEAGRLGGEVVAPGGEAGRLGGEVVAPGGEHGLPGGEIHGPGGEHGLPGGEVRGPGELGGEFRR